MFSQNTGNTSTSIAMLNYLATEARIIISSRNNRLALDDSRNMLINNTNPGIIDVTTQEYMENMLGFIESFRMIELQRERLQFLLENSQAQAITKAMPNPLYLLGSIRDINPVKIIATIALMTLDSVMQYQNAKNEGEIQFLKDNWELDDTEAGKLHELRTRTFSYMIDIARTNKLPSSDTLNEESIDRFVSFTFDENLQRKKQALESNRSLYYIYGPYWLELADTYYRLEMYQDCIKSIKEYEAIQTSIFRKDYSYAKVLPFAIISAFYIYDDPIEYSTQVTYYLEKLIENTTESQWQLRYFAAQNYLHLASTPLPWGMSGSDRQAAVTDRDRNLRAAYALLLDNVRVLSHEQEKLLLTYSNPINEKIPSDFKDERLKQAKEVIKNLKNQRKTELPPLHEGLLANCMILFPLMQEIRLTTQQRNEVSAILDKAFIFPALRYNYFNLQYRFGDVVKLSKIGVQSWKGFSLELPVIYLSGGSEISVNIRNLRNDRVYTIQNISYNIIEVIRGRNSALSDYRAKIRITLPDEIKIERGVAYELSIGISIIDSLCSLVFLSPGGKTDFSFYQIR